MKSRGFTYIEVMIALAIFSILIVFVMNINHSSAKVMSQRRMKLKELYIAQMEMERWKINYDTLQGSNNIEYDVEIDDKGIKYIYSADIDPNTIGNIGQNDTEKYHVKVQATDIDNYLLDIVILVKKDVIDDDSNGEKLESHIFKN
ncbi:type II secretion system protein [Clostridium sp. DJ247]|uniref:type II secretion system protein n=1 Tax=Clostridium sp. DJ247 TaxID=2726188 RepID=UPI00162AC4C5|nr:type II secretion system protein [Clostridium sp. DJ247]MBC2579947.1 type II secretion system protein [Clostridium sp. DJ247]